MTVCVEVSFRVFIDNHSLIATTKIIHTSL